MPIKENSQDQNTNACFSNVPVMWKPKEDSGKRTREFMKIIEDKYKIRIDDYWDLHKWSIENVAEFWGEYWHFTGVIYSKPYHKVIDLSIPMSEHQEWFEGAEMNFAENLLKYRDDHIALIDAGEDTVTVHVTYAEMYEEAKLYAAALRRHGVMKGDRVACYMPNRKEAVFAMLGATSLGAVFVGALPFFGSQAILTRLKEVQVKVMFSIDRFLHKGEENNMLPKLKEIGDGLPLLEKIIIVASKSESKYKDITGIKNSCFLDDFLELGKEHDGSVPDMVFEQVPFTHPVFITYTSGTTGLPKTLIHSSGILLSTSRDFWLSCSAAREDRWLFMSAAGWASWNWFITMLFSGVTMVLHKGCTNSFWDIVDELQITNIWTVPSVLDDFEKKGYIPGEKNQLKYLKIILNSGCAVKPRNFDFVYKKIKSDVLFFPIYGTTETMVSCLTHDNTLPVHRGEITAPALGIDIQCLNDEGEPVVGELGNLVIAKPFPSLLVEIWEDPQRSQLKRTYFDKYPGKFFTGDFAIINPITKGTVPCGRCDDTVTQKFTRLPVSDIYDIVRTFSEVQDCLCVSQLGKEKDARAVFFLKMEDGHLFNEDLAQSVRSAISKELSVDCVPDVILEAADIPYNMNGKKMETIVRKIINELPFNSETVRNPECLEYFGNIPELRGF